MFKKLLILLAAFVFNSCNCAQEDKNSFANNSKLYQHKNINFSDSMKLIKTNLENKKFDLVEELIVKNYWMLSQSNLMELSDCIKLKIKNLEAIASIYKFDLKFLKKILPDTFTKIVINILVNAFCDESLKNSNMIQKSLTVNKEEMDVSQKNIDLTVILVRKSLPKIKYIVSAISAYKWIKNSYKAYYNNDLAKEIKDLKKIELIVLGAITAKLS